MEGWGAVEENAEEGAVLASGAPSRYIWRMLERKDGRWYGSEGRAALRVLKAMRTRMSSNGYVKRTDVIPIEGVRCVD